MADKPVRAFGANIVQLIGVLMLIIGVATWGEPLGVIIGLLGVVVIVAATARWRSHTKSE